MTTINNATLFTPTQPTATALPILPPIAITPSSQAQGASSTTTDAPASPPPTEPAPNTPPALFYDALASTSLSTIRGANLNIQA